MARKRKWFQEAVRKGATRNLDGWSKKMSASRRRRLALQSRPDHWPRRKQYLSAGRALQALANVTKDRETKRKAKADAKYFFNKLK